MIGSLKQEDNVQRFFSEFAEQWDTLYGGKRNTFWRLFDQRFRRDIYERYQLTFAHLGADLSGKSILDVGCGSGVYCMEAARRGAARVLGIDVAGDMIEIARARSRGSDYEHVCEFLRSDFPPKHSLEVLGKMYDYGIVMGVMDYVPDPKTFLRCLRPLISHSVILSFPGQHWLRGPVRRYRYKMLGRCDVFNYDEGSIRDACVQAGFSRLGIQRLDHSGVCYIVLAYV